MLSELVVHVLNFQSIYMFCTCTYSLYQYIVHVQSTCTFVSDALAAPRTR
jgi:hypothetical protein